MPSRPALLAALAAALALAACGGGDGDSRTIRLALDFQPNAVHAGIYTATAEGLDRRRGIRLRIRVPAASTDSLKLLAAGRADASIVDIHDLGLARERGQDVVAIGAIVQRPLAAVIARHARRPRDLRGRRVGVTGAPSDDAVLDSVLRSDGLRAGAVRRTTIGFSAVPALTAGKVAAVTTFWNAEGVALRRRGVHAREFRVDRYGAPRYPELVLVVKRSELRAHRDELRDLVAALRAGTRSALREPGAAARRVAAASGTDLGLVRAQLRAVAPALRPPLALDRSRLEAWARFDSRFGILRRRPDVDRAFAFAL